MHSVGITEKLAWPQLRVLARATRYHHSPRRALEQDAGAEREREKEIVVREEIGGRRNACDETRREHVPGLGASGRAREQRTACHVWPRCVGGCIVSDVGVGGGRSPAFLGPP